jgi:transposase-like protein
VSLLNYWLQLTAVGPELNWRNGKITFELCGGSLFGVLAVQLALAVNRSEGLAVCDGCKKPYIPRRQPRADQRHYCPDCGSKAALRDAQRDQRARKAEAEKLNREGVPAEEIAKRLSSRVSTVNNWIRQSNTKESSPTSGVS